MKKKKPARPKKRAGKKTVTRTRTRSTVIKTVTKNPAPNRAQVLQAATLYEKFHGAAPRRLSQVTVRPQDKILLRIGPCLGVMYEAVRDGKRQRFLHQFEGSACPLLASSADGKQLYLVGGRYDFTADGITDRPTRKR